MRLAAAVEWCGAVKVAHLQRLRERQLRNAREAHLNGTRQHQQHSQQKRLLAIKII